MDALILSRIQFAINIAFHFFYPPLSIGIGLLLVFMEGMYLKTKNPKYKEMTQFWIKIFALTFAIGVATGLVQSFAFGTNWARYSRYVGDVFGSALAAEGIFAFFLESGFLGLLLFGWDRVKPGIHYMATIFVCLGAHFSAVWIIVANSWMQTPAGYVVVGTGDKARAVITDFWAMVFNPSSMDRLIHVLLGCWLSGIFFMMSVSAYYLVKKRHHDVAKTMMKMSLVLAAIVLFCQLLSGDSSAKIVAKYQPAKLAAFEGIYKTEPGTPISVIGWVDAEKEKVYSLKIPAGLSLFMHGNTKTPVTGLDQIPRDQWPNVPVVFQSYHLMVLLWGIMCLITLFGAILLWRKKLEHAKKLLWAMVFSVLLPQLALQAGWCSTEVGRQPWIVYGLMRTKEGLSKGISAGQVTGSIIMFILINLLLFFLFLFLLDRKIKHGPEPVAGKAEGANEVYRDPYHLKKKEKE